MPSRFGSILQPGEGVALDSKILAKVVSRTRAEGDGDQLAVGALVLIRDRAEMVECVVAAALEDGQVGSVDGADDRAGVGLRWQVVGDAESRRDAGRQSCGDLLEVALGVEVLVGRDVVAVDPDQLGQVCEQLVLVDVAARERVDLGDRVLLDRPTERLSGAVLVVGLGPARSAEPEVVRASSAEGSSGGVEVGEGLPIEPHREVIAVAGRGDVRAVSIEIGIEKRERPVDGGALGRVERDGVADPEVLVVTRIELDEPPVVEPDADGVARRLLQRSERAVLDADLVTVGF